MGMDLKEAYGEVSRRLDRLDFGMLLPGLHRYPFALHTEAEVCLGDRNFPNEGRFLANTAMEFEGRRMAVWRLSATQQNYDTLAASLVHEMCHAFQVETKTQFPDLIFGAFYPRNLSNYTAKYVENLLLAGLLYDFDPVKWDDLLSLRARRLMSMPEAVRYEQLTEGIEGQAKYVELKALAKLSPGQHSSALSGLAASLKDQRTVFDARRSCYDSGAAFLTIAEANGRLLPAPASELGTADAEPLAGGPDLSAEFQKYFATIDALVAGALGRADKVEVTGSKLLGFDPYNVRSSGNRLYHPNFIMCGDSEPQVIMGTFVTVMKEQTRELESVYKVRP
ncbi:MAG: hypothetical protein A2X30_08115 [Elusimicrobia bacterium GWB2_63_16]|nr:MAG: hypothetical protein A2X30_08115 [Elusimicrobia bacterium GWB2_63_16]